MAKKRTRLMINPENVPYLRFPRFGRPAFTSPGGTFTLAVKQPLKTKKGFLKLVHPGGMVFTVPWKLLPGRPDANIYTFAEALLEADVPDDLPPAVYDVAVEKHSDDWELTPRCLAVRDREPAAIRIAHISNINFNNPTAELLREELTREIDLWNPDIVFASGDLCEWDWTRGWKDFFRVIEYLQGMRGPVVLALGNHDNPDLFAAEIGKEHFHCRIGHFHFLVPKITTPDEYLNDDMAQAWLLLALGEVEESNGIGVLLAHDAGRAFFEQPGEKILLQAGLRLVLSGAHIDFDTVKHSFASPETPEIGVVITHQSSQTFRQGAEGVPHYRMVEWNGAEFKSDYHPEKSLRGMETPSRRKFSLPTGKLRADTRLLEGVGMEVTVENQLKRGIHGARVDLFIPGDSTDYDVRGGRLMSAAVTPCAGGEKTYAPVLLNAPEGGFARAVIAPKGRLPELPTEIKVTGPRAVGFGVPFELEIKGTVRSSFSSRAICVVAGQGRYHTHRFNVPDDRKFDCRIPWVVQGSVSRRVAVGAWLHSDPVPVFHEVLAEQPASLHTQMFADSDSLRIECRLLKLHAVPDDTLWTLSGIRTELADTSRVIEVNFPLPDGKSLDTRLAAVLVGKDWQSEMETQALLLRAVTAPVRKFCTMKLLDDRTGFRAFPETNLKVRRRSGDRLQLIIECAEIHPHRIKGPADDTEPPRPIYSQESIDIFIVHMGTGWGRHLQVGASGEWMLRSVDLEGKDYGAPSGEGCRVRTGILTAAPGWYADVVLPLPGKSIMPEMGRALLDFQVGRHRSADGSLHVLFPCQGVFRDRKRWGKLVF